MNSGRVGRATGGIRFRPPAAPIEPPPAVSIVGRTGGGDSVALGGAHGFLWIRCCIECRSTFSGATVLAHAVAVLSKANSTSCRVLVCTVHRVQSVKTWRHQRIESAATGARPRCGFPTEQLRPRRAVEFLRTTTARP